MRRECTCRGMNENCCFCSGSGYIDGARTMHPAVPAGKIKRVQSKAEARLERQIAKTKRLNLPVGRWCPHCKHDFQTSKKLAEHLASEHADVAQIFRCDICKRPFLEESSMKAHRPSCLARRTPGKPVPIHQQTFRPSGKKKKVRTRDQKSGGPNKPTSVYQDPKKERLLDGSRGSHMFRDQGRFGSHSTHDDHGDESKP